MAKTLLRTGSRLGRHGAGVWPALLLSAALAGVEGPMIQVDASRVLHPVSRYLTGACIEDVNHEIYGGLYSQMLFGESFQEPATGSPVAMFAAYGGGWRLGADGELTGGPGDGPKLVSEMAAFEAGEVSVEIRVADRAPGNAGLILKVANAGVGADRFDGYEVSLDAQAQMLRLGRHRQNWTLLRDTPYAVPTGRWVTLAVRLTATTLVVSVDGRPVVEYEDREPLPAGTVGLRPWQREASFRRLRVTPAGGAARELPFVPSGEAGREVSGMWRPLQRGTAEGRWWLEREGAFVGVQSQGVARVSGEGEVGVENQGLNRWGLGWVAGRPYEGRLQVRTREAVELVVALESRDGAERYAEQRLSVAGAADWQAVEFGLTPRTVPAGGRGRFTVALAGPGSVRFGYALLQPGEWGRFHGLPVRRDVADGLVDMGITVLRYGGSMVNHPQYRWKTMIGPRDRRPPVAGTWYPYSTNGWGIVDFVDFCEAAGFLCIPAFNMGETPQDMADFVEYVNGPADSEWGRRRAAAGHPLPYRLQHLELGNEERVDDAYAERFQALADAIWAKDPEMIIVVGDFVYSQPIVDPERITGAASRITSLAAQRRILGLAKARGREVWFDLHVGTDGPRPDSTLAATLSFADAMDRMAAGARQHVAVFEFNSGNHSQRRALANALAILALERDGRFPVATSANGLQPDGQNDNGWDQGLLFLDPTQVWLQPPGWVTRMLSRHYQPCLVACEVVGAEREAVDAVATRSQDGRALVLQVVNSADREIEVQVRVGGGFRPASPVARVEELAAPLTAVNTAAAPGAVAPRCGDWPHGFADGSFRRRLPAHSFTVLQFE